MKRFFENCLCVARKALIYADKLPVFWRWPASLGSRKQRVQSARKMQYIINHRLRGALPFLPCTISFCVMKVNVVHLSSTDWHIPQGTPFKTDLEQPPSSPASSSTCTRWDPPPASPNPPGSDDGSPDAPFVIGVDDAHPIACHFCDKAFAKLGHLKTHEQVTFITHW